MFILYVATMYFMFIAKYAYVDKYLLCIITLQLHHSQRFMGVGGRYRALLVQIIVW